MSSSLLLPSHETTEIRPPARERHLERNIYYYYCTEEHRRHRWRKAWMDAAIDRLRQFIGHGLFEDG